MERYDRGIASGILLVTLALVAFTANGPKVGATGNEQSVPPALDGVVAGGCGYVQACGVSLTTARPNDVVIVGCDCWPLGTQFSVKDSAGLLFRLRTGQVAIGGGQFVETWYAISSSALSADRISVSTNDSGETWYGVIAFAVSGANTASPFVPGLPDAQANLQCAAPCNQGVSAPAGSFVFQVGGSTGSVIETAGAGMTLIEASGHGSNVFAQYDVLSNQVNLATLSFGAATGSDFGVVADAINPAGSSGSITPSSGPLGDEMVVHAFATSWATLAIPTMIIRWDSTPLPVGSDAWQVEFAISDSVHNQTILAGLTTINGQHNFTVSFYQGSTLVSRVVSPLPSTVAFPGNFGQQEFTDFYYTPSNQINFFWYAPHGASIMVSQAIDVPHITPTDVAAFFAPIKPGQSLQFNFFQDSYFSVGQDTTGPQVAGESNQSPCATHESLSLSNNIDTNACEVAFTPGIAGLDETMISEPIGT